MAEENSKQSLSGSAGVRGCLETLFGVVLPIFCLLVEVGSGVWKDLAFDPIPKPIFHGGVIVFLASGHLWLSFETWKENRLRGRIGAAVAGLALGFSLIYFIAFLPIAPFAVLGLVAFGLGVFPLTPLICFPISVSLFRRVLRQPQDKRVVRNLGWSSFIVAIMLLAIVDVAGYFLRNKIEEINSSDPTVSVRALLVLREDFHPDRLIDVFHEKQAGMLLEHYLSFGQAGGEKFGSEENLGIRQVDESVFREESYYRITGNRLPKKEARIPTPIWRNSPLELTESEIEASIDVVGGTAHADWNFVVRNDEDRQREGLIRIQVHQDAVVSRARLWVRGKPQEAAFARVGQAELAYETVAVVERRDPLLVSRRGAGLIELRFAPVPSFGTMRFAIGFSMPLELEKDDLAYLTLPSLQIRRPRWDWEERNEPVMAARDLLHQVSVRAGDDFSFLGTDLKSSKDPQVGTRFDADLPDSQFPGLFGSTIRLNCSPAAKSWALDPTDPHSLVVQTLSQSNPTRKTAVVVVDRTASMATSSAAMIRALSAFDSECLVGAVVAGDRVFVLDEFRLLSSQCLMTSCQGGNDGYKGVKAGFELAREKGANFVIWIHGGQEVSFDDFDMRRNYQIDFSNGPRIVTVPLVPDLNVVANRLRNMNLADQIYGVINHPDRIQSSLRQILGLESTPSLTRECAVSTDSIRELPQASDTGVRLMVARKIENVPEGFGEDSVKLAIRYGLVTSVTSAVCLETKADYKRFNLLQKTAATMPLPEIPTVPEPGTWALILLTTVITIGFVVIRSRSGG